MRKIIAILVVLPAFALADGPGADSHWRLEILEESTGYGSVAALQQDSATTIKDESAVKDVTPRLEFRCTPGDTTVTARINWERFISSFSTEVGFKVDGGRFSWLKWKLDPTEQVTMSPSGEDTRKLIALLNAGSELLVEVSPYSQGPETATFDLLGFSDALAALTSKCQ